MTEASYTDWRNLIGDFMMEFARVEDILDRIICDAFPNEYEPLSGPGIKFKRRATHVLNNIDLVIGNNAAAKQTKRSLNELIKLADNVRNIIAHYPLELTLEQVFSESPEMEIRSSKKKEKAVTFEMLSKSQIELTRFSKELENAKFQISCQLYP